ncbi:MAG: hypothetical protein RBG13Loki_0799 [Promethearchaeota archaeon CR_4]|nr:MAG: hypothetical protein RBG13Loki_0799 [Candidatus Lokiarchaeota archaeon CR_4]
MKYVQCGKIPEGLKEVFQKQFVRLGMFFFSPRGELQLIINQFVTSYFARLIHEGYKIVFADTRIMDLNFNDVDIFLF